MTPLVRTATPADAEAACEVIRRSIAESCIEDHHRDPTVLATWLANKTPEGVRSWIASPDAFGVVAEADGAIVGFAMLTMPGEISLCYLVPEAQDIGERGRPPQPRRAAVTLIDSRPVDRSPQGDSSGPIGRRRVFNRCYADRPSHAKTKS